MDTKKEEKVQKESLGYFGVVVIIVFAIIVLKILPEPNLSSRQQVSGYLRALEVGKIENKFKEVVGSYQINSKEQTISLSKENFSQVANFSKDELEAIVDCESQKVKISKDKNLQQKFQKLIGWYRDNGDGTISFKIKNFASFSYFSQEELQELINQGLPKKRSFW